MFNMIPALKPALQSAALFVGILLSFAVFAAAPAPEKSAWLAQAQQGIAQREYHASESAIGLQAPNRAQSFRTYFDADGIRVVTRDAQSAAIAGLRLAGVGRGSTLLIGARRPAVLEVMGNDAETNLRWPGLHAQYRNSVEGLAQQISIAAAPAGSGALTVAFAISDAIPELSADGVLLRGASNSLRLGELRAVDASGRALPISTTVRGDQVLLSIDDRHAQYPIAAKTLLTGFADALLQSNQVGAALGWSVAGAGDVNGDGFADVIVGAISYDNGQINEGAAFVFFGSAGGFNSTADVLLESNQLDSQLGFSVAGAGDVNGDGFADIIVGAIGYDNGQNNEGAAFVYFGSAGVFNSAPDALLESNQADSAFGRSVAGAGDVNGDGFADVIVGASRFDNGQNNEGAAFIYFGGAGAFNTASDAQLESNQTDTFMGTSVAGAGDVNSDGFADVVVGAIFYSNGETEEGAAFVYFGSAGAFNTSADALLESNQAGASFGTSVAGAGDVNGDGFADVIVGASGYDNGQNNEGAAFIYFGGAGAFNTASDALLESDQPGARMGVSVAGAGDVNGDGFADAIVGLDRHDGALSDLGAAFVYYGGAGVFDAISYRQLEGTQVDGFFGFSVAGAGDVNGDGFADVIVGAYSNDSGQAGEGAAFIFFGGARSFNSIAKVQMEPNQDFSFFGTSLAGAGDVNGDGFADVIIGAREYDNGQSNEGAAFVYFGGAGVFNSTADALLQSNQVNGYLGFSVAGAGDVNGDGFADVIVGVYGLENEQIGEGAAFIYFGGSGAFNTDADAQLESNQEYAAFGYSVAGAGDVNGDGFADVIVGAFLYDNGQVDEGAAFIYFGGAGAFNTSADAQLEPNQVRAEFGASVAGAGDVNGDGFADVIVGATDYDSGQVDEGAAFVYFGGTGAFNTTADARLEPNLAESRFGYSVAGAGDINGDGFADAIVGAARYSNGQIQEGAIFIYFGSAGAFNNTAVAQMEANQAYAFLGASVASAGDVNGDGFADIIVGASGYSNGQTGEGAAYIYFGGAGVFNTIADVQMESNQGVANFGSSVASCGDVNGDSYPDVIVGAADYSNGQVREGAAFMYTGTGSGFTNANGRLVLANQYRNNGQAVQPWGLSQKPDGFAVALSATSPRGRERARLQIEACANAIPFGSLLCNIQTASSWTELNGGAGSTLAVSVDGLNLDRVYKWRARVQYAPLQVSSVGITSPPKPAAGPWRRLQANADAGDIRTSPTELIFADGFE